MFWNLASKSPSRASQKTSLYFVSPIGRSKSSFVDKTADGRNLNSSISITFSFMILLSVETMTTSIFVAICSCRCVKLTYQTLPKGGRQNCNNVHQAKELNNNLPLFIFEEKRTFRNISKQDSNNRFLANHGMCQSWNLLQTRLDTIMFALCQDDDTFDAFLEKRGIHFCPKMYKIPLFISVFTHYLFKSSILRSRQVFSRFLSRG